MGGGRDRSRWWSTIIIFGLIFACQAWISVTNPTDEQPEKQRTCNNVDEREVQRYSKTAPRFTEAVSAAADLHDGRLEVKRKTNTDAGHGWRARLVNDRHRWQSLKNLSTMERIAGNVVRSKARSDDLNSKIQFASNKMGRQRRMLQSSSSDSFESQVNASANEFSMAFTVGTPPQNFSAVADTGSDLVWIQCTKCRNCIQNSSTAFDPSLSSTYKDLECSSACDSLESSKLTCSPNCKFNHTYYYSGSAEGDFASETVYMESTNGTAVIVPNFKFGCGLDNTFVSGKFQGSDGVVGLGRGPISFPSQISTYLGGVNKFSYCLNGDANATSPITFGSAALPDSSAAIKYTPLLTPRNTSQVPFYFVNLQNISVGGTVVSIPASALRTDSGNTLTGTILDSGTTYTVLNSAAYTPVIDAFRNEMLGPSFANYTEVNLVKETGLELCYEVRGFPTIRVPTLDFHFENATLSLPFYNIATYIVGQQPAQEFICIALTEGNSADLNIIGSTQQQNFQILFDEDAQQIGWVEADCASS